MHPYASDLYEENFLTVILKIIFEKAKNRKISGVNRRTVKWGGKS